MTLKVLRLQGFAGPLLTLGDYIKARRLALGLRQRDVARLLGVCEKTLINWEKARKAPQIRAYPAIARFLRIPYESPGDLVPEALSRAIEDSARQGPGHPLASQQAPGKLERGAGRSLTSSN